MFLLLFFEPFSIAFETMQAILVHGFQLLDIWIHSAGNSANCQRFIVGMERRSYSEFGVYPGHGNIVNGTWSLCAYLVASWHGISSRGCSPFSKYTNSDQALLGAMFKRIKGFIKLRKALGALHAALPDATTEELQAYDDECAICREPMAKAKKLHCKHLFHLACLRSWLDQGLSENYSCPTCRKPLFIGRPENEVNPRTGEVLNDEQLARQIGAGLDRQNNSEHTQPTGVFPNQTQNPIEGGPWSHRSAAGLDSNWLHAWPNQGVDGAGPSNAIRSVGLGRVQMVMRHLASVGETYAQTAIEDGAWSLWPMNPSQAATTGPPIPQAPGGRYTAGTGGLHMRTASHPANDNLANILAMAETVREVLPHIPDDLILQDLQRTNSVSVTVNNLLQM
uniref:RING-type E3 ubiquitin transferase n=1 Tax=Fagus sylvatica TaxID=28930 RepID=A0A2N9ELL9_FAGSY